MQLPVKLSQFTLQQIIWACFNLACIKFLLEMIAWVMINTMFNESFEPFEVCAMPTWQSTKCLIAADRQEIERQYIENR